ncbi:epithelial splicing regulatory protein 1/2 [Paragonimus westermani]|uniref:Epithelial splicing regulatory protein 1/2 n=1 Tax=Paragonimus westermani TaxID=34504 RepID=A0A5J4NEH9_9TREM|nr:epithelial splicing regulatory protein 1/2 [Paragonimus westermani]
MFTLNNELSQLQKWLDEQGLVWQSTDPEKTDNKRKPKQADYNQSPNMSDENRPTDDSLPKKSLVSDTHCHNQHRKRQARTFAIVTDGPLGIRLVLHPEVTAKSIDLSSFPFMYQYLDLRTIFRQLYQLDYTPGKLSEMFAYAGINFETSEREFHFPDNDINAGGCWSSVFCARTSRNQDTGSQNEAQLSGMEVDSELGIDTITCNQTAPLGEMDTSGTGEGVNLCQPDILLSPSPPTTPGYLPITHCRSVAKLIAQMHAKVILQFFKISRKTETVDDNLVVRARGLPWQATDMDIARFFSGLNIAPGGISLVLSDIGRRNGEALVQFTQPDQRDLALRKHKHHMGQRYIEVYAASGRDFVTFAGDCRQWSEVRGSGGVSFLSNCLSDLLQFFANANCPVQYGEAGVLFVNRRSGQATGDAFVMFETQALAAEALKSHRQHIGNRYIELFKSTPAEVNQVVNTALNLSPTLPPIRNCVKLDVESALTAAATLAVGANVDINERVPSNATLNQVLESTAAVTSQTYNPGYPLFGSTSLSQLIQTNGLYLSPMLPAYPPLGTQPTEPMFNADNFSLYRANTQLNSALFPGGATLVAPHPFASKLSNNFTATYPLYNNYPAVSLPGNVSTVPLTSAQPNLNYNWYTPYVAGNPYHIFNTMEQFARSFIRIKGLPFDADITDILIFLEDHRYSVALHGVHQVYSPLVKTTDSKKVSLTPQRLIFTYAHFTFVNSRNF